MFRLNLDKAADTISNALCFYHKFTKHEHKEEILKPLFLKAIADVRKFRMKSDLQRKLGNKKKRGSKEETLHISI